MHLYIYIFIYLSKVSTGKEHYASRAFECSVNHRGMITSATRGFYGSVSDKSIVKFDGAMMEMKNGMYSSYGYELYDKDGNLYKTYGGYSLCDNGYHKWFTMMNPSKIALDDDDYNWSEMLESLRKDVECLFGEMKQEFAVLKYGCRFSSLDVVDDIFLTCCAIHNQRKIIAGLDQMWKTGEIVSDEESDLCQSEAAIFRRLSERHDREENNGMGGGEHTVQVDEVEVEHEDLHDVLRKKLITHFKVAHEKGEVFWPTRDGVIKNYVLSTQRS